NQVTVRAVEAAGDGTRYSSQLAQAYLSPWQVKKVVGSLPPGERAAMRIDTTQLATRLGQSLTELAADSRAQLSLEPQNPPVLYGLRMSQSALPEEVGSIDLMSGTRLQPGGEARRRLEEAPAGIEALHRAAQKYRNVQALLERAEGSP